MISACHVTMPSRGRPGFDSLSGSSILFLFLHTIYVFWCVKERSRYRIFWGLDEDGAGVTHFCQDSFPALSVASRSDQAEWYQRA